MADKEKIDDSMSYADVAVCLGITDKSGKRQEIVHQIDGSDVRIVSVSHSINKKVKPAKDDDGAVIGFEPTGEYELTLKVKYIKE